MNTHSLKTPAKRTPLKARTRSPANARDVPHCASQRLAGPRGASLRFNRPGWTPCDNRVEQPLSIAEIIARTLAEGPAQLYRGGA